MPLYILITVEDTVESTPSDETYTHIVRADESLVHVGWRHQGLEDGWLIWLTCKSG